MSDISSLIEVFRMNEISPKSRAKIIIALGNAIDNENAMSITYKLVYELVKILDPENNMFKPKE